MNYPFIVEAHAEKKEAEMKESLTLVWLGEYYHRTKRLPSLKDELKKISGEKKKAMTDRRNARNCQTIKCTIWRY